MVSIVTIVISVITEILWHFAVELSSVDARVKLNFLQWTVNGKQKRKKRVKSNKTSKRSKVSSDSENEADKQSEPEEG